MNCYICKIIDLNINNDFFKKLDREKYTRPIFLACQVLFEKAVVKYKG